MKKRIDEAGVVAERLDLPARHPKRVVATAGHFAFHVDDCCLIVEGKLLLEQNRLVAAVR